MKERANEVVRITAENKGVMNESGHMSNSMEGLGSMDKERSKRSGLHLIPVVFVVLDAGERIVSFKMYVAPCNLLKSCVRGLDVCGLNAISCRIIF